GDIDPKDVHLLLHWTRLLWLNGFTDREPIVAYCSRSAQGRVHFITTHISLELLAVSTYQTDIIKVINLGALRYTWRFASPLRNLYLWREFSVHTPSHIHSRARETGGTEFVETVVKTPGLSSPCTMECGEGLLTAFGVGFTPHIQGQAGTDLRLRPHPVDTLLHLAIAPVAPLHRIRGGGQQCVVKKRQGLFQSRGKELFEGGAHLWEPQEPTPQCGQFGQRGLGPTAPIE